MHAAVATIVIVLAVRECRCHNNSIRMMRERAISTVFVHASLVGHSVEDTAKFPVLKAASCSLAAPARSGHVPADDGSTVPDVTAAVAGELLFFRQIGCTLVVGSVLSSQCWVDEMSAVLIGWTDSAELRVSPSVHGGGDHWRHRSVVYEAVGTVTPGGQAHGEHHVLHFDFDFVVDHSG
jgi:hypothetical protein